MRVTTLVVTLALAAAATTASRPAWCQWPAPPTELASQMTPLPEELLAQPITLTRGCAKVVVREWVVDGPGSDRTERAIAHMDRVCNLAVDAFPRFIKRAHLAWRVKNKAPFEWNVSVIRRGRCHRCMNDYVDRFRNRFPSPSGATTFAAYTTRDERFSFVDNDISFPEGRHTTWWVTVWVHELFHAMSMHSGIFDSHSRSDVEKVRKDEVYARRFQRELARRGGTAP